VKRIVIIPVFCESHLIKYQIPNIVDTINPDYIVYNEGLFPNATEGQKSLTKEWLTKYTLNGEGRRGFDFEDLQEIIINAQKKYPDTNIILNEMDYQYGMTPTDCFIKATTNFEELGIKLEEGDCIFPFEGDVFHHENSKDEINGYIEQLKPDEGFRSVWIDYHQNQYYCEKQHIPTLDENRDGNCMSRRICIKFGTMDYYLNIMKNFMSNDYHDPVNGYGMLYPTDLVTYHYSWWRPGKFRDLRCDQLMRQVGYWDIIKHCLDRADELIYDEILIRPNNRHSTSGWIKYWDEYEHPKHVKEHPCYLKDKPSIESQLKYECSIDVARELLSKYDNQNMMTKDILVKEID
jgi:hypothetical protein